MTDEEMANESLISYRKESKWAGKLFMRDEDTCYKDGFLAGLKAGRPQWHYVKDGDYPDTDRTVLAYSDDVVSGHYPYFAQYYKGFTNAKKNGVDLNWNCWRNNMQRELVEPTVWCETPTFDKEKIMFEKEAEFYAREKYSPKTDIFIIAVADDAFKDGAEFGYNKANEWHYVKDGDLPKDDKKVLCILGDFENDNAEVGYYSQVEGDSKRWRFEDYDLPDDSENGWGVSAWKEIVLPKESE